MSCVLRIEGVNFRVDEFLNETGLHAFKVWRTGEPIHSFTKKEMYCAANGCNIDISTADFDEFDLQKSDAIRFLTDKHVQLQRLSEFGLLKTEIPVLDFGVHTRMILSGVQVDMFQPELLRLAGSLNFAIELSQYEPNWED